MSKKVSKNEVLASGNIDYGKYPEWYDVYTKYTIYGNPINEKECYNVFL